MILNIRKYLLKSALIIAITMSSYLIYSSILLNPSFKTTSTLIKTYKSESTNYNFQVDEFNLLSLKKDTKKYFTVSFLLEDLNNVKKFKKELISSTIHNKASESDLIKARKITNSTPLNMSTATIIVDYSNKLDIPISLVLALIELESNFKKYEVGAANDRGYFQIIPETEKWLANSYGHILSLEYNPEKIFEPNYNIGIGMLYLHILKKAYGENYHKILSEYNRGIYNLKKYFDKHGTYVTTYSRGILDREKKYINLSKN